MLNLFLVKELIILPIDKNIGKIKNNLNFEELKKSSHKNNDVYLFYPQSKINSCPRLNEESKKFIDIYYNEFNIEIYQVQILFFEITNTPLLTPELLKSSDILRTAISHHFTRMNDLDSNGDLPYSFRVNQLTEKIEEKIFYDLSPICDVVKTKLFNYQINNINWMLNIEKNKPSYRFNRDRNLYFPDGRIYTINQGIFKSIDDIPELVQRGGIIADEVGKGKTVQLLTLCAISDIPTLIIVPSHLKNHWESEIEKHLTYRPNLKIVERELFNKTMLKDIRRLICDEFHELTTSKSSIFEILCDAIIEFKWGITGTPFANENTSITYLWRYIFCDNTISTLVERFTSNSSIIPYFYRKNIGRNITDEIELPPIRYVNHLLKFNSNERIIYEAAFAQRQYANEIDLREFCCDFMVKFDRDETISEENFRKIVYSDFEKKWIDECKKLEYLEENLNNIQIQMKIKDGSERNQLKDNETHFLHLIKESKEKVRITKIPLTLLSKLYTKEEKVECPICRCDVDENIAVLKKCCHIFCYSCIKSYFDINPQGKKCAECREPNSEYWNIQIQQEIQTYSTKFTRLLSIISETSGQIIIYTQFDKVIKKMMNILEIEGINSVNFSTENIEIFRNGFAKVLILSSSNNASGLNLSFCNNIVIFEPIKGDTKFLKDIELQIIGRIWRINQKQECIVHRLIIKDTIEEKIYSEIL